MSAKTPKWLRAVLVTSSLLAPALPARLSHAEASQQAPSVREIEIVVEGSYKPNRIEVHEGERVRLRFVRKEYTSCTKEVVFPQLNIRRELPPNKPVIIELPKLAVGEYEFKCGMNMIRGTLVVVGHHHHG